MKQKRKRLFAVITALLLLFSLVAAMVIRSGSEEKHRSYLQRARADYIAGNYDSALLYLRRAVRDNQDTEAMMLMADCYEATGNYTRAVEILRQMNTGDPAIASRIRSIEQKRSLQNRAESVIVAGSEYERNTKDLNLDGRGIGDDQIKDITALYALNNLSLANNSITDIRLLSSLGGLDSLNLSGNEIRDIRPLSGLRELRSLNLDGNPVADLTPLYSLSNLNTLRAVGIQVPVAAIADLSEKLPNCAIVYESEGRERIRLGPVDFETRVTQLDLSGLGIRDLTALSFCTDLKTLKLSDNSIYELQPLMMLSALERLDLSGNSVSDLRPLIGLPQLRELNAANNLITETVSAGSISSLRSLDLSGNTIADYSGLGRLQNLTTLTLQNCGLKDAGLSELQNLKKLQRLDVMGNPGLSNRTVGALKSALPGCTVLCEDLVYEVDFSGHLVRSDERSLAFPSCGIRTLTGLDRMTALEELDLSGNEISLVYPFEICSFRESLRRLNLAENQIRDISSLSALKNLEQLDLRGNPINREQLAALQNMLPDCEILF